ESAREGPRRRIPLHPRGGDAGHAAEQPCRERDQLTELVPEMVRERQKAGDEREHGEERSVQPRADSCSQPVAAVRWIYDVASGGPASEPARALAAAHRLRAHERVLRGLYEERLQGWDLHQDHAPRGGRDPLPVLALAARAVRTAADGGRGRLGP